MNPAVKLCLAMYRGIARAFPQEFQIVYGAEVVQLGEDAAEEIWRRHGVAGLARLLGDLAVRVPMEYASEMRRDVGYAVRALAKSPGFSAVGIISLGLGIGVATAGFSEMNAFVLREMPAVKNPKELVMARGISYPYFEQFRTHRELFSGVAAAMQGVPFGVAIDDQTKPERVFGQIVSPDYFSVFGVGPVIGRVFDPSSDQSGEPAVVVVSERFWRDRLHADPAAVGRRIRVNGRPATIVGVAARDFLGVMPIIPADLFLPVTAPPASAPELAGDVMHNNGAKVFSTVFRLAPGVTIDSAEAALDTMARQLDQATLDPERNRKGRRVALVSGGTVVPMNRQTRVLFLEIYGTLMGLMLTIACMNLANMLLARGAGRRKEIAIRLAVGASRFRLIRQLVMESLVLALAAGVAGFLFGDWLTHLAAQIKPPTSMPWQIDIRPDMTVMLFTFAVSIVAGLGFGVVPAFAATRADVAPALKENGGGLRAHRRFGLRNVLVVMQVAGSLALLLVCGFLVLGYHRGSEANVSFDPAQMDLFSIDPVRDGYTPEQAAAFFDQLPSRIGAVGGVEHVALATAPPFGPQSASGGFSSAPAGDAPMNSLRATVHEEVSEGYFASLSAPLLAGREFSERDRRTDSALQPLIVNQDAAAALFGHDNPLGRRIEQDSKSYQVIGVAPNLSPGIFAGNGGSIIYSPLSRNTLAHPPAGGITLMVRTSSAAGDAVERIRGAIASLDPNLTVFNARTLDHEMEDNTAALRIGSGFYGAMGAFGLILASIGLGGVTAYSVAQRRKEIGIRMALGARKGQVLRLVLREGSALVVVGSALGFLWAWMLARTLAAILNVFAEVFHTAANDPRLMIGAPVLLAGLAMLACYWPARKSAKIDPLVALREE